MISKRSFELKKNGEPSKYCYCRYPELIDNYDLAVADVENVWICHHKLEAFLTMQELKDIGRYFDVPPRELVFVRNEKEHQEWPHKGHIEKIDKFDHNLLKQYGNQWNKGRHWTKEHREKYSETIKDRVWWTNGDINKLSIDQPGPEFRPGRTVHWKRTKKQSHPSK